jgi:hypothetical protein
MAGRAAAGAAIKLSAQPSADAKSLSRRMDGTP